MKILDKIVPCCAKIWLNLMAGFYFAKGFVRGWLKAVVYLISWLFDNN